MGAEAGPVVSEPRKELVGGGANAKYVKECKELYLAGKGIEKLRGFEPFVSLESLWLNSNKLRKINNLDQNFRIKALYAHDNQICTLRGSLLCFKFLEVLDLSNNQLRDLDKQLRTLEKLLFLKNLNLVGNPCVEEPDYRLIVIHHMPQLRVLDQHVVTDTERRKAAALIGGDVQSLTVAFGQRMLPYDPAWDAKVPERSVLEQSLVKEAATIREVRAAKAYEEETALFKHNPYPDIPKSSTLPPNAGTRHATAAAAAYADTRSLRSRGGLSSKPMGGPRPPPLVFQTGAAAHQHSSDDDSDGGTGMRRPTSIAPASSIGRSMKAGLTTAFTQCQDALTEASTVHNRQTRRSRKAEEDAGPSPYVPKDVLRLSGLAPSIARELTITHMSNPFQVQSGSIKFEEAKFDRYARRRTFGTPGWRAEPRTLVL